MKLSPTLSIDSIDYASQGNAILGIRNSGKSYTATFIAERLMDDGIPFIAFDPIGIWRYLKVGRKGAGYPVVVAGDNGDLPLTPESAADIVRAAMKENVSLVVDLYSMKLSKADWRKIVEQCIRLLLYENKPCGLRHIFIEEAAEFCPQRVQSEDGKVYAEIEKLARMGGNASLGYTLINQRAEEVNKAVLELCDCLFLHRQKGRHSLTALGKWLDVADTKNAKAIINSLPSLEQGECWVWDQGSHDPQRVQMPQKKTVHPDRKNPLATSAGIPSDVSKFVDVMTTWLVALKAKEATPEVNGVIKDGHHRIRILQEELAKKDETIQILQEQVEQQNSIMFDIKVLINASRWANDTLPRQPEVKIQSESGELRVIRAPKVVGDGSLGKCARTLLMFLASYDREFSKIQVGVATDYSPSSSGFQNALSELSTRELIIRGAGLRANKEKMDEIVALIGPVKKTRINIGTFRSKLSKCEGEIYDIILKYPGERFSKESLAGKTASRYSATSSGYQNALSRLNVLEIIRRENGSIILNPDLAKML